MNSKQTVITWHFAVTFNVPLFLYKSLQFNNWQQFKVFCPRTGTGFEPPTFRSIENLLNPLITLMIYYDIIAITDSDY